ncbi:protein kinase domain-containing protein [Rubritalea spongiae]
MIEENYQIEEMVEQAPFYVVYEALDKRSGEKCLIKRYLVDDSSEIGQIEGWKDQFTELLEQFKAFKIASVRNIIDGGLDSNDGKACSIFEWLNATSLVQIQADHPSLGLENFTQMAQSILKGLVELHARGVLQARLTPETILYTETEGKSPWVILWDPIRALRCKHGVNRFENDYYTAPELINGDIATAQSDLYALGKVLENVACEYTDDSRLQAWHTRLVNADAHQRYSSAQEALNALREAIASDNNDSTVAQDESTVDQPTPIFAGIATDLLQDEDIGQVPEAAVGAVQLEDQKKSPVLVVLVLFILVLGAGAYYLSRDNSNDDPGFKVLTEEPIEKKSPKKQAHQAVATSVTQAALVDSAADVILTCKDTKAAHQHLGEVIGLKGKLKDIILANGDIYVLTCTPASARRGTICATANPSTFFPDLNLKQLRSELLGKQIIATGPLKKNPSTYSIHLADASAVHILE